MDSVPSHLRPEHINQVNNLVFYQEGCLLSENILQINFLCSSKLWDVNVQSFEGFTPQKTVKRNVEFSTLLVEGYRMDVLSTNLL